MRKLFLLLTLSLSIISCNNDDDSPVTLIGAWNLVEVYNDPGDGSGGYVPASENKTLQFFDNGTVTTSGIFCNTAQAGSVSTGTYDKSNGTISPNNDDCLEIGYTLTENSLVLAYPCIEACLEKYAKFLDE